MVRAAGYGLTMPLNEYTLRANQETLVSIQIETMEAINNIDELLTVDGVDFLLALLTYLAPWVTQGRQTILKYKP